MIGIGMPPRTPASTDRTDPAGQPRGDLADPRRDPLRRHDQRGGGLARDGGLGTGHEAASGRSHAFDRRLKEALDERGDGRRDEGAAPRERVLAVAEAAPGMAFGPHPAAGAAPAPVVAGEQPGPHAVGSRMGEEVAGLVSRIEEAYRLELSGRVGQPVSVSVPLDGLSDGLGAITVTVTQAGLDVTLMRSHGGAPSDLVEAAQLLAVHLQTRFSKRSVWILERLEDAGRGRGTEGDALFAIGRLLGNSGR